MDMDRIDEREQQLAGGVRHLDFRVRNLTAGGRGFSMIELIGVVAVISILAALLVPTVIRRIDMAATAKEYQDMAGISNAIALQVLTLQRLPTEATWASEVAAWNNVPVAKVTQNPRRVDRVLLIDTNGWLNNLPSTGYYPQPPEGVLNLRPSNARMVLVSSTAGGLGLPAGVVSGRPGNTVFNAIWDTREGAKPNLGNWNSWNGKGDDVVIQRINLTPLWFKVTLVNRDKAFANYAIGGTSLPALYPNASTNACYLNGTMLSLNNAGGLPMRRVMITRDESFVFESGAWRDAIGGESSSEAIAQDFASMAAKFLAAQWYTGSHQGGDQQGAMIAMFDFMLIYGMWANQCPYHFPWHGANNANVPEYLLLVDMGGNGTGCRINEFTGQDGLLK